MTKTFVFRKNQTIGAGPAESDGYYLKRCFVDTGDLDVLRNCDDPRSILVGRTGTGKSALFLRLAEQEEHIIQIHPESLCLTYIANSNVLQFFTEAGVKMDIFYRLLWRHVFCVEVLKDRFDITTEEKKKSFLEQLWTLVVKNKQHEMALDYLREWGESFWKETEYRVKEVTNKLETELQGSVQGSIPNLVSLNAAAAKKLGEEQKVEVVTRAQEVVNKVQIRELSNVIKLIDEVLLSDRQQRYFIVIDKLDERWVEDNLRFRLIRALIETSVEFSRIVNLKVIVAIRSDLLDRVYRETRDAGFQEEKYATCSLDVSWSKQHLTQVLDCRINVLVKDQYTGRTVTHGDILPERIGKEATIDYMLDCTLMRPRDIIQFFNLCIQKSDGKPTITAASLREAEGQHSRDRLKALFDEWYGLYPNIPHTYPLLKGKTVTFTVEELTTTELADNALQLITSGRGTPGLDYVLMDLVCNSKTSVEEYRKELVFIFYKVGLVGLKIDSTSPFSWSHLTGISLSSAEISNTTKIQIQRTFWRVLGMYERDGQD